MIARALGTVLLALGAAVVAANAGPAIPPTPKIVCTFKHKSRTVDSLKKMPGPIRKFINKRFGSMADRGEYFDEGDAVEGTPRFTRFIRGGEIGEKWFFWYEQGGIAYRLNVVLVGSDPSGTPHLIAEKAVTDSSGKPNLCRLTDSLLDRMAAGLTP